MSKSVLFTVCMFLLLRAESQVTVNVQLPAGGMVQKDQLWNLVLINNNSLQDVSVSIDVQDAKSGQPVLSASSRIFSLGKGMKVLNARDVQPVQYNYIAAELSGNYIPLGDYVVCYRVVKNDTKGSLPLGDECVKIHITPLSPPLLNTPANKAIIENPYPAFSWMPPLPGDMFSDLNYELLVAEISPGQTATEAILYNTPVYTRHDLKVPYESYNSTFSKLKEGQHYAWQVVARNGLNYTVQTEVWSFSVKPQDSVSNNSVPGGYLILKNEAGASGLNYLATNQLSVKYYSFDAEHETTISLLTADNKVIKQVKQKIKYGDNFLTFGLTKEFKKEVPYIIQVSDQQNNRYTATFILQ